MKRNLYLSLIALGSASMIGWAVHAQSQRSVPARQAWEYKSLVFIIEGSKDGNVRGGSATPVARAPELGDQGWELVSVAGTSESSEVRRTTTTTYAYWFKRPK
jgi:hypothetical protein